MGIIAIRKRLLTLYAVVLIIFGVLLSIISEKDNIHMLLPLSICNIVVLSMMAYRELTKARDFHPFMIMLIAAVQYVGFNGLALYQYAVAGEPITFGVYDITDYLTRGAYLLSIEHFLLYLGFTIVQNKHDSDEETLLDHVENSNVDYYKWAVRFYAFVVFLRLAGGFVNLQSISSILVNITNQGQMVTLMLLLFAYYKSGNSSYMRLHWIILVIEFGLALQTGMKESMLQNLIPYVVYLFLQYKSGGRNFNLSFFVKMGAIAAFILYFAFPYVSIYREQVWLGHGTSSEAFDEYVDYITGTKSEGEISGERDVDYMTTRVGSIGSNTWSMMYADKYGHQPIYMVTALSAIIPRAIWRDKPQIRLGAMIYALAIGHSDWLESSSKVGTAYTSGFIGSCYFSWGWWFAILMPFLMGYVVMRFWYFYKERMCVNIVAIYASFTIVATAYKDFENFTDGGIIFCTFCVVYYFIIKYMENHGYSERIS